MNIKASLQLSRLQKIKKDASSNLLSIRSKVGHKAPLSLCKIIVNLALDTAEFWMDTGCGSAEEMVEELHKAGKYLSGLEYK